MPLSLVYRYLCKEPSNAVRVQFSIVLMVTGAVIAGATDLTYSLPGYVYVAICAVSTAVYLVLIRVLKDRTGGRLKYRTSILDILQHAQLRDREGTDMFVCT